MQNIFTLITIVCNKLYHNVKFICRKGTTCKKKPVDSYFASENQSRDFAHFAWLVLVSGIQLLLCVGQFCMKKVIHCHIIPGMRKFVICSIIFLYYHRILHKALWITFNTFLFHNPLICTCRYSMKLSRWCHRLLASSTEDLEIQSQVELYKLQ